MFSADSKKKILKKTLVAIGENEKRRQQTLQILREWIRKTPHLTSCPTTDFFLLAFCRSCKYSLEKIKHKLDMHMSMRTAIPEFFSGWDPRQPVLREALSAGGFLPLLEHDQLCQKVIVMRPGAHDPQRHSYEDVEKANFMVGEVMGVLDEDMFITGAVVIFDFEGFTFNHLNQRSLPLLKKYMRYTQEAVPVRAKGVHFIRMSPAFNTVHSLIVGFATEKIRKRFRVHGSDLSSLYKDVPRKILPRDYGGDGPSLSELTGHWKQRVEEHQQYLASQEKLTHADESKRSGNAQGSKELFGIEGSFRKLEID